MHPITLREFQQLTHCRFGGDVDEQQQISGVQIDSRRIVAGNLFVALPGATCHGLQFAQAAGNAGACLVLTAEADFQEARTRENLKLAECAIAFVPDAVEALQAFATWNRQQSTATVIAVTGSVGKTTTRGLIASVLRQAGPTVESPHNYNNHLGVPLTLLQLAPEHRFAVVEIGTSAPGEVARLATLVQPTDAVITRIAAAHVEGLKTIDAVAAEKLSLLDHLSDGGTAWFNAEDAILQDAAMRMPDSETTHRMTVRLVSVTDDIKPQSVVNPPRLAVHANGTTFTAPLVGRHNTFAMRTAVEMGRQFGLDDKQIQAGFDCYRPQPGRCQVIETGFGCIIDDTYNASPASVEAAIELLSDWPNADCRILVLGDMLELGVHSDDLHARIGTEVCNSKIDQVWLTGPATRVTADVIRTSSARDIEVHWCSDADDIGIELREQFAASTGKGVPRAGSRLVILIKGSRGMRMERVVHLLTSSQ